MKTWYRAVCDNHKEMCLITVNNPVCGAAYLGKHSATIQGWLSRHADCDLRLVHSDVDLEPILGVYLEATETTVTLDVNHLPQTSTVTLDLFDSSDDTSLWFRDNLEKIKKWDDISISGIYWYRLVTGTSNTGPR